VVVAQIDVAQKQHALKLLSAPIAQQLGRFEAVALRRQHRVEPVDCLEKRVGHRPNLFGDVVPGGIDCMDSRVHNQHVVDHRRSLVVVLKHQR
jgi:hypothetical protein